MSADVMCDDKGFCVQREGERCVIDATGVYYRQLNERIRAALEHGVTDIEIVQVRGQRYIATAVEGDVRFTVRGVPGQDLGAFMRGPTIHVHGNAQDGVGNTMDGGRIVIHGMAGDVLGYAMRDGRILVRGDVGYRVGIHMKAYMDRVPVIVAGGKAGDFLGEYMAGGAIILLGMHSGMPDAPITGRNLGTGMHGGVIYLRGRVPEHQLGPGLAMEPVDDADREFLRAHVADFAAEFAGEFGVVSGADGAPDGPADAGALAEAILSGPFVKIRPFSHRPYGNMYVGTN